PLTAFFGLMNQHLQCHESILLHAPSQRKLDLCASLSTINCPSALLNLQGVYPPWRAICIPQSAIFFLILPSSFLLPSHRKKFRLIVPLDAEVFEQANR